MLDAVAIAELKPHIDAILAQDAEQQRHIAAMCPPGSGVHRDTIAEIEVIHVPHLFEIIGGRHKSVEGAAFRIRARTRDGLLVLLRKVPSPETARLEAKRAEIRARFEKLIGMEISFWSRQSARGRYVLTAVNSSLPPEFRHKEKKEH